MTSSATIRGKRQTSQRWSFWTSASPSVLAIIAALLCTLGTASATTFLPGHTTFPATQVNSTSAPVVVTLKAQATGTASAPVVTTEAVSAGPQAEFNLTDPGTCASAPSLAVGQTCTVAVTFTPHFPGVRHGAVSISTSDGYLLASTLISGVGQGSLPILIPGQISTVVGNGQWYYQQDGVPAVQAPIYLPAGLAVDAAGDLYLADSINNRVRKVDAKTHLISTVAGTGSAGNAGDNGPATSADLASPTGLALDGAGNLYIADTGHNTIRRVDAATGVMTTLAGTANEAGYTGDGHAAKDALLNAPQAIALTPGGDLIIADTTNAVVRVITAEDGYIRTIAGTGNPGFNQDGIQATAAMLNEPSGLAVRSDGAIAVADLGNNRIRLINLDGTITTIAGDGTAGYTGDGGGATQAELQGPASVAFGPNGDLFIADSVNNCVRLVFGTQGTIMTLAGVPSDDRYAGDGGPDDQARMHGPDGLVLDAGGNLWISDRFNNRIREVNGSLLNIGPFPTMKVGKVSQPVPEQMFNAGNQALTVTNPTLNEAALDSATTTCSNSTISTSSFCKMGVEFAPTEVGPSVSGSIQWNTNAPFVFPMDQLEGQVLSVEPTSVVLSADVNPGLLGQPVTLTATVTSADKSRTGTVDFVEGGQTWCAAKPLASDGTAVCQIPSLSLGEHDFVANYSGDNNNAASQSASFQEFVKQQAALALSVSVSPAVVTNNVVLSLSAADSTGTPTGTVIFYDGATPLQTVTLNSQGNAAWTTNQLLVGSHTLSAKYSGDNANVSGTTSPVTLQVIRASTVTVLNSSNTDTTVGAAVSLTANVVSNNGPAPTGSVQFLDGSAALGSVTLGNSGSASLLVNSFSPGNHTVTAVYSGDTDDDTSTSAVMSQKVERIGTTTTLVADANPQSAGAAVRITATVQMAPGATADGSLNGTITFAEGSTTLGTVAVDQSGQAMLVANGLAVGYHAMTATYNGNVNYAISNSAVLNEHIQPTATSVALSAASSSVLAGEPATFTVVVGSATGIPTGTISLKEGSSILASAPVDPHGSAIFTLTQLSVGAHTLVAVYSGDSNYLTATSPALGETVVLANPSLVLTENTATVDAGTNAYFTVTLTSNGVAPTGTVALVEGNAVFLSAPVSANGTINFSTATLPVGQHGIKAQYSGDSHNAAVTSTTVLETVQPAVTSTALVSNGNPLIVGQQVVFTATVTSDGPHPGGTIDFFDDQRQIGSILLSADGKAALSVSTLALGSHPVKAVYVGDTNHAASTSTVLPELIVQSSSLSVSSNVNPSFTGQSVTFSGRMTGTPTPTGSLRFTDNGTTLATVPLDGTGAGSFTTADLAVGSHAIGVVYSGDPHFNTVTSQLTQQVLHAQTATTLQVDQNPSTYSKDVTFTIAISSSGGAATGDVVIAEASKVLGVAHLDASGKAQLTTSLLGPGLHQLVASYPGDGKASASASQVLSLSVKQVAELSLTSDSSPAQTLSPVVLTASVHNAGAAPATGAVSFTENGQLLGTANQNSIGQASIKLPQLSAGTHNIQASYAGDIANFATQSGTLQQQVVLRPTSTTVTGTNTDSSNPQQVTLIAVVHGSGSAAPSGTVNFTSGSVTLGAASVDATGVAAITVIFNSPQQQVVAAYTGDLSYAASQSSQTPITAGTPAKFTVALSSSNVTVASHQHTTITVTLASVKDFTDNISLGCLGLPYAATCTFSDTHLKLNANGTITASLLLDTGNPLGAGSNTSARLTPAHSNLFLCGCPCALLLFLRRKRAALQLPTLLLLCGLFALASGLAGCAGLQMSGTPPGTYSFRVVGTGQGSNVTETQAITLVVTQ